MRVAILTKRETQKSQLVRQKWKLSKLMRILKVRELILQSGPQNQLVGSLTSRQMFH